MYILLAPFIPTKAHNAINLCSLYTGGAHNEIAASLRVYIPTSVVDTGLALYYTASMKGAYEESQGRDNNASRPFSAAGKTIFPRRIKQPPPQHTALAFRNSIDRSRRRRRKKI